MNNNDKSILDIVKEMEELDNLELTTGCSSAPPRKRKRRRLKRR